MSKYDDIKLVVDRLESAITGLRNSRSQTEIAKHIGHVIEGAICLGKHRKVTREMVQGLEATIKDCATSFDTIIVDANEVTLQGVFSTDRLSDRILWRAKGSVNVLDYED